MSSEEFFKCPTPQSKINGNPTTGASTRNTVQLEGKLPYLLTHTENLAADSNRQYCRELRTLAQQQTATPATLQLKVALEKCFGSPWIPQHFR